MDQFAGFLRMRIRGVARSGRAIGAEGYGLTKKPAHRKLQQTEPVDDAELTHRVMSEILRDPAVPKGAISINAQEGVV